MNLLPFVGDRKQMHMSIRQAGNNRGALHVDRARGSGRFILIANPMDDAPAGHKSVGRPDVRGGSIDPGVDDSQRIQAV